MKLLFVFVTYLMVVALATAHGTPWYCDLSNPATAAENTYYLSTLAAGSGIWQHDVTVITPDPANFPQRLVQTYSTWQLNYANSERCAVSAIEFNPRITENGEFAIAIQEIDARLLKPCYATCRVPSLFDTSSDSDSNGSGSSDSDSSHSHSGHGRRNRRRLKCEPSRPFTWVTPVLADAIFTANAIPHNTILADKVQSTAWEDKDTGAIVLFENLYTVVPQQHRLYSLSIPAEFVPGNPYSTDFAANVLFNSNALPVAPPFIQAALAAYQAGQVPILTDPNSPPGLPLPVYLYIVPTAKLRSEDMAAWRASAETLQKLATH